MSTFKALGREVKFATRDRPLLLWMILVVCLSSISVAFGLVEVKHQKTTIGNLLDADKKDRQEVSAKLKDWGSAAYYNFHFTYNAPSNFAFAAMGQRDVQPWKHRIRMLALEGQIYERDVGNPSTALIGRFDFAFFAAFIFPLVLIMLLYDLRASEKIAGRYNLLEATAGRPRSLWLLRVCLRAGFLFLCLITPLIIASFIAGTSAKVLILASIGVFIYSLVWAALCYFISSWRQSGSLILMTLIGIWLITAVVLPAGARLAINRAVVLPSGADILLLQRETVNDAWDLPRDVTMTAFFEHNPEWLDYEPVKSSFEWPWYYAFQQVGDQKTEHLAYAYRDGRLLRDRIAAWVSILTPPALLERALQSLANTDVNASIAYEDSVRAYHGALRAFYYPKFFRNAPFEKTKLEHLPKFDPGQ